MIKLLIIISNAEKEIKQLFKKYKLVFNNVTYGSGTASKSLLSYFGLDEVKKNIYFSLIPSNVEQILMAEIESKLNIKEYGKGIAFTISLNSSNKYIYDTLKGDNSMTKIDSGYDLIATIVKEGYSDLVMQAAKSSGATGGTVIYGRSLGSSRNTIIMDIAIEPEKDIVLIIVPNDITKQVIDGINKKTGVKTAARGLIMSMKIDSIVGLHE